MKRIFFSTLIIVGLSALFACNSAKKEAARKKKTEEKMEQLEKNKREFEQKNK